MVGVLFMLTKKKNANIDLETRIQTCTLELRGWPKFKSIPDNIQGLTALKSLRISHFNGMETLPEWLTKLSSLQTHFCFVSEDCDSVKLLYLHAKFTCIW